MCYRYRVLIDKEITTPRRTHSTAWRWTFAALLAGVLLSVTEVAVAERARDVEGRPWLNEDRGTVPSYRIERERPVYSERYQRDAARREKVTLGWQGNVQFDLGSNRLHRDDAALLDDIYRAMQADPSVSLLITGHTDNIGNIQYNRRLSEKRSNAVAAYLIDRGIDPQRIHTRYVGEERPVASNRTPEDRERNRRADLAFFPTGSEPPAMGELVGGESEPRRIEGHSPRY